MARTTQYVNPIFYERFNAAIDELGVNGKQIASALGVQNPTVYRWRAGITAPNSMQLMKFCKHYHISADWLFDIRR